MGELQQKAGGGGAGGAGWEPGRSSHWSSQVPRWDSWGHEPRHCSRPCASQPLTFFFSLEEGSLPEQRPGSTPPVPLARVEDLARLLSTSSSSNFFLLMNLQQDPSGEHSQPLADARHTHKALTAPAHQAGPQSRATLRWPSEMTRG